MSVEKPAAAAPRGAAPSAPPRPVASSNLAKVAAAVAFVASYALFAYANTHARALSFGTRFVLGFISGFVGSIATSDLILGKREILDAAIAVKGVFSRIVRGARDFIASFNEKAPEPAPAPPRRTDQTSGEGGIGSAWSETSDSDGD